MIDPGAIELLRRAGGDRLVGRMRDLFVTNGAKRVEDLKTAAATADGTAASTVAHSFRSSAGQIGASSLAELCATVESEAPGAHGDRLSQMAREVEELFSCAVVALNDAVNNEGGTA